MRKKGAYNFVHYEVSHLQPLARRTLLVLKDRDRVAKEAETGLVSDGTPWTRLPPRRSQRSSRFCPLGLLPLAFPPNVFSRTSAPPVTPDSLPCSRVRFDTRREVRTDFCPRWTNGGNVVAKVDPSGATRRSNGLARSSIERDRADQNSRKHLVFLARAHEGPHDESMVLGNPSPDCTRRIVS